MAEYERKYTKLSRYAGVIIVSESDRCKSFERGLKEIRTSLTPIAKWSDCSHLVETTLRVEQILEEVRPTVEQTQAVQSRNSSSWQDQRHFIYDVFGRRDFKSRFES